MSEISQNVYKKLAAKGLPLGRCGAWYNISSERISQELEKKGIKSGTEINDEMEVISSSFENLPDEIPVPPIKFGSSWIEIGKGEPKPGYVELDAKNKTYSIIEVEDVYVPTLISILQEEGFRESSKDEP